MSLEGKALFLVEPKYFDETKKTKDNAAAERKRKAAQRDVDTAHTTKRARTTNGARTTRTVLDDVVQNQAVSAEEASPHAGEIMEVNEAIHETAIMQQEQASRELFEAERRAVYEKVPQIERNRTKRKVEDIEPALDDMINAKSRPEIGCFRRPAIVYFAQRKNGKLQCLHMLHARVIYYVLHTDSDHLDCQPDSPAGCSRCIIRQPSICCELCNPQLFEGFAQVDLKARPKRPRKRSPIKDYKPDACDLNLRDALHRFRQQETIKKFGHSGLKNSGPGLTMPNEVLQ
jgi:hypothetical protein